MYRYIEPEYLWTCPKDGKKFSDPQHKCRECGYFTRFHTDNVSGLDTVIGCKFQKVTESQTLIHLIATKEEDTECL